MAVRLGSWLNSGLPGSTDGLGGVRLMEWDTSEGGLSYGNCICSTSGATGSSSNGPTYIYIDHITHKHLQTNSGKSPYSGDL